MLNLFFKKRENIQIPENPGLIPSPEDKRDVLSYQIAPIIKRIPKEYPCGFDLEVFNQSTTPSCVGQSLAGMKQYLEARERVEAVFDGFWIYNQAKKIDGIPDFPGTYLRVGLKILQKQGAKPVQGREEEAVNFKIGGYAKVDPISFDELKKMIAIYGVVLLAFTGSNEGWKSEVIRPPKPGEKTWGHAVFAHSYTEDWIIFRNSWGKSWGNNGDGRFNKDYLPFEAWVVLTDLPTDFLAQNGLTGWVAKEFLATDYNAGQVVYTTTNLNIRDNPNGNKIKTLPKNQKCVVVSGDIVQGGGYNWVKVIVLD